MKITSLFDVLSQIGKPDSGNQDYFFAKQSFNSFDSFIVVGVGHKSRISNIDNFRTFDNYVLDHLYKFNLDSYELVEEIEKHKIHKRSICKSPEKEDTYFMGAIEVKAFKQHLEMGNGLLRKFPQIDKKIIPNGIGKKFHFFTDFPTDDYLSEMPFFPGIGKGTFAYFQPENKEELLNQMRNLDEWVGRKKSITEEEFAYVKNYKEYLNKRGKNLQQNVNMPGMLDGRREK